jgi:aryl-alcohol dehydrogenase-like predicted oxidoreductase
VTRLGLGLAPIGGLYAPVSEEQALATVERAWELGLRFFDTAPLYGYGLSERRVGKVLRAKDRGGFVLSTKVGRLLVPGGDDEFWFGSPELEAVFDFSPEAVVRSHRESLERLGLDRVDVLLIHDPDDHFEDALAGAYPALDDLRRRGVVSAVGVGMNQAPMPARFVRTVDLDCVLLAGRYTLLDQSGLDELLPLCAERGTAVIAAGVYNSGLLADPRAGSTYDYAEAPAELVERAVALGGVCERHGVPLKAAAIQFPLGHSAVACALTGARSARELEENVRMLGLPVPAQLWADLKAEGLLRADAPVPAA